MTTHRTRPATPAEQAADYAKREAALERAEAEGVYSPRQLAGHRAALEEFTGYPRDI